MRQQTPKPIVVSDELAAQYANHDQFERFDVAVRKVLSVSHAEILRREGMETGIATNADEASKKFRNREWDVIVTDLRLGESDGVSLLNEISREAPATISIVLTGFPTLPSAISAIRAGVHDYLIKPCKVMDMVASIKRGLAKREAIQAEAVAKRASIQEMKRLARMNLKMKAELNRLRR